MVSTNQKQQVTWTAQHKLANT